MKIKLITSVFFIIPFLASCENPTKEMDFKIDLNSTGGEKIELVHTIANYSKSIKKISDIDVDKTLHDSLNLKTTQGTKGIPIPIDNTISYTINKKLKPNEKFKFVLVGNISEKFVSGQIDFIVNDNIWHMREISVSCCKSFFP